MNYPGKLKDICNNLCHYSEYLTDKYFINFKSIKYNENVIAHRVICLSIGLEISFF